MPVVVRHRGCQHSQDYLSVSGAKLNKETTLVVGFNTGLGSGNVTLMASWVPALFQLCKLGFLCVWTCASENVDAVGELRVMQEVRSCARVACEAGAASFQLRSSGRSMHIAIDIVRR